MHRFWFEFQQSLDAGLPPGTTSGCGVTAHDYEDAIGLVRSRVFRERLMPPIARHHVDVDISQLDPKHVLPNIGNPASRGVWFPLGYD